MKCPIICRKSYIEAVELRISVVDGAGPDDSQDDRGGILKPKIPAGLQESNDVDMLELAIECPQLVLRGTFWLVFVLVHKHLILQHIERKIRLLREQVPYPNICCIAGIIPRNPER
jgi:hypothetical protein